MSKAVNNETVVKYDVFKGVNGGIYRVRPSDFFEEGSHGSLAKTYDSKTEKNYVMKLFDTTRDFERELKALKKLQDSSYVISLIDYSKPGETEFIVLEKMDQTLQKYKPRTLKEVFSIIHQWLNAMKEMRERGVVHGDLHRSNIMIDILENDVELKVIDFGTWYKPEKVIVDDYIKFTRMVLAFLQNQRYFNSLLVTIFGSTKKLIALANDPLATLEDFIEKFETIRKTYAQEIEEAD